MVARGDLGVELQTRTCPIYRRESFNESTGSEKPVIDWRPDARINGLLSTPLEAEVTDVANAIIDGTDAVNVSEETAIGNYPVEAVQISWKVAEESRGSFQRRFTTTPSMYEHGQPTH